MQVCVGVTKLLQALTSDKKPEPPPDKMNLDANSKNNPN